MTAKYAARLATFQSRKGASQSRRRQSTKATATTNRTPAASVRISMASKCGTESLNRCMICLRMTGAFCLQQTMVSLPSASSLIACSERRISGDYCRYRMAGKRPLTVVEWLALTSGAVPRSMSLRCANEPTNVTKIAPKRPRSTIFKWVLRLALYIE